MEGEDSSDQSIDELYANKPAVHSDTLKISCSQLLDMYIYEEYRNLGLEIGRLLRWGELEALGILSNVPDEYQLVDTPGLDIFGNPVSKKYNYECECSKCHRTVAANRFTSHLAKCMGMGRTSYHTATRRIAASANNANKNSKTSKNSAGDSSKNTGQASSSRGSSKNPLNGELGSEDDEEDDDDVDRSLDRKKKSEKSNEKVAVKRKGPMSRVKKTDADGVGSKRRRGVLAPRRLLFRSRLTTTSRTGRR